LGTDFKHVGTARQAANKRKSKGKRQKSKGKNLSAGPRAGLGRNFQGLAAIKTIVNESILERRRKLATSRNLRGAQRNGTLVVHWHLGLANRGYENIYLAPALDCAARKHK